MDTYVRVNSRTLHTDCELAGFVPLELISFLGGKVTLQYLQMLLKFIGQPRSQFSTPKRMTMSCESTCEKNNDTIKTIPKASEV